MQKLWIYGAGGHGRVVYDVVSAMEEFFVSGFIDDDKARGGKAFIGHELITDIQNIKQIDDELNIVNLFIAIGDNASREEIAVQNNHYKYPVLMHPTAVIGKDVKIGCGTIVMPGSVIESGAEIGEHCIINNGSIIGHCSVIEDFCHIGGNSVVCGEVSVGKSSMIGIGSCITPQIKIGVHCMLGAGSVITRDVPDEAKMFGNPARNIKNFS